MRGLALEWYKLRRKYVFLMILLFLSVEITWGLMATATSMNRNPSMGGWEPMIAMMSSMNGLFYPILSAICVSRICDMEHKGNTWKLLLTVSVKGRELYRAKYVTAFLLMAGAGLLQGLAMVAFAVVQGFGQSVPIGLLIRFFLGTILTNMMVLALQQWISMAIKNQAFALSLGMIGGFIGIAADLFPAGLRGMFPWAYYTGLSPITQSYYSEAIHFLIRDISELLPKMAVVIVVGMIIYLAGSIHVSRQEV